MKIQNFGILCIFLFSGNFVYASNRSQDRFLFEHKKIDLLLGIYKEVEMKDLPDQSRFQILGREFSSHVDIFWDNQRKKMGFKPKKAGSTLVTFVDTKTNKIIKQIRVFINQNDLDRLAKEVKLLLSDIEGIKIKILNNKILIDGQIILPSDMIRINSVIKQYKQAVNLVRLSPLAMIKMASLIERDIGSPEISIRVVNGFFILEGIARDLDERDEALRIAQAYLEGLNPIAGDVSQKRIQSDGEFILGRIINHLRISPEPPSQPPKVVQVVVHFVELSKSYQRGFSFQWVPTISDGTKIDYKKEFGSKNSTVGNIAAVISNLLPKLNWAREHGHARVLKSVSMIVEDRNSGVFNSIRQIPTIIQTLNGPSSGLSRDVGVKMKVTPQVTGARSNIISMKLNFDIGEVLESTQQGPIISRNIVDTRVTVRSGESAAIGGLVSSGSRTSYNKLPQQAQDPLFKLLASKDFSRGQSQFVVFVTPFIKTSASAGVEKIKKKFRLEN